MRLTLILAAAAFCVSSLTARADTFETFDLNATILGAGTITGTVNLDLSSTSTHNFSDSLAGLTFTNTSGTSTIYFNSYNTSFGYTFASPYTVNLTFYNSTYTDSFQLYLPVTTEGSLAGFDGGLCTYSNSSSCHYYISQINLAGSNYGVLKGTFAPDLPAATPEPTSFALLGTGLLGLAGGLRKRLRRRA